MAKQKINYKSGTFARFFRAKKGRQVSRFGTARYDKKAGFRNASVFGGSRAPMKQKEILDSGLAPLSARPCNPVELNCEVVTAITHEEARRFRREYDRAVRQEDIEEVTEEDYIEWLELDAKRADAAIKRAKKLKKEREDAAAKEQADRAKKAAERAKAAQKGRASTKASAKTDKGADAGTASPSGTSDGPEVPPQE